MVSSGDSYRALRQLPAFPAIATKLLRVLSHDDASVRDIVDLIRADAALASELLRVVNSPIYGFDSRISSIQRAVTILGFEAVRNFALSVSMKGFMHASLRLDLLRGVWRHSLATAMICEEISSACSTSQGRDDRAYTVGLLHDIGRMGLFVSHPELYSKLMTGPREGDLLERERQTFGIDHCDAGAWLAQSWGFPADVQAVISSHHSPPNSSPFGLADLVRIGVLLADSFGFDIVAPEHSHSLPEIRAMLPTSAQFRFDPDGETFKSRIMEQLDAFD